MHIGRKNQLGIALEAIPGIAEDPTYYIPFLDCTLQERHTPIADAQAKGLRDAEGGDSVEGKKWAEGKIEVVLDPTTAPYWFALALGEINSNPDSPVFNHTITQSQNNEPLTATIWKNRTVDSIWFKNAVVNTLELSFADDVAKLAMDIMSKYPEDQEESPSNLPELKYYTFRNATVTIGGTVKVRELTLKIENDAEMIYAPSSNDVDRIACKSRRVSGSFKLLFESETQKEAFKDLDKQELVIAFTGDNDDSITITIPKFRVDNWTEEASIDDLAQEGIDFVAEYDEDTDETIDVEIVNSVEEYKPLES